MSTEHFIDSLIDEYAGVPGYPFPNWADERRQFEAVRAFFDVLFKAAAGKAYSNYENVMTPQMSADFSPYDVALIDRQKRVAFYPSAGATGFVLVTNFATDGFEAGKNRFGEMPDRSWFTISTDFGAMRLAAVFEMVRIYTNSPFTTLAAEKQMDRNLTKSFGHLFDYPASKLKAKAVASC